MFVIKTHKEGLGDYFKAFESIDGADHFWRVFIEKAVKSVATRSAVVSAELYDVDAHTDTVAIGAVKAGMGDRVRRATLSPPENLRSKVSRGGKNLVTREALEKAQEIIEKTAEEFPVWARDDLRALGKCLSSMNGNAEVVGVINEAFKISYRLKGRGGTFGYGLITIISDHLCSMLQGLDFYNILVHDAIHAHIGAMKIVIANKIVGNGEEGFCDDLIDGLEAVSSKIKRVRGGG